MNAHLTRLGAILAMAAGVAVRAEDGPGSAFRDAVAAWHFAGAGDAAGLRPLTARGDVRLGVELEGEEREASLARGGDGRAARFDGGHFEIGGPAFDPAGAEFTLLLRVRDDDGSWDAPLFGSFGGDGAASLYLRGVDGAALPHRDLNYGNGVVSTPAGWMFGTADGPRAVRGSRGVVEFLWGAKFEEFSPGRKAMLPTRTLDGQPSPLEADAANRVLRVMFPAEVLGLKAWHDVVVRGSGARLELWVDGVMLDLEFPRGATRPATAPRLIGAAAQADGSLLSGFRGLIDHAALWHRPLADAEIVAISGGEAVAKARELAILGPLATQMQYYRARGHNSKAGDCFPIYHDGTYHLFYLILRRNMHSKWDGGHGGLEVHHASTRDLVRWEHHPVSVPITEPWEAWNGTGNTVFRDGKFQMFYPTPDYEGGKGGVQLATSADGVHFAKDPKHPYVPGGDCEVFNDPDPNSRTLHMLKDVETSGAALPELKDRTLVAWASPTDLDQVGAGVLTVEGAGDQAGRFDSLVLGEVVPRRWMAGSENLARTQRDQQANAEETAKPGEWVQLAASYSGRRVVLYRNGSLYAEYPIDAPLTLKEGGRVLLGLRHLDRRDDPDAHFRGAIADARVYDVALTAEQIAALRPHEPGDVKPVAWFDFQAGSTADRAGTLAAGDLEGSARIEGGSLVLDGACSRMAAGGRKVALGHWVSEDGATWTERPEPFIVTDESVVPQMCPHWFRWNGWYYFITGVEGVFRSREPYGPWTRQLPGRLDNLVVPKTAEFAGDRRILAGFVNDDGWGGDLVMRELVQHPDGSLGTRFVPEMTPAGAPRAAAGPIEVKAEDGRTERLLRDIPNDARITMTLEPVGASRYGLRLRAGDDPAAGTELRFDPKARRISYSASTHSGGGTADGPSLEAVPDLDRTIRLDIVCRRDLVDVEVNGRHTLVDRYWNPKGNALGLWAERGGLRVVECVVSPLK